MFSHKVISVLITYQGLSCGGFFLKIELVVFVYELIIYLWLDLRKLSLLAQEMKSNLLLIIKPTLLHYLKIPST